MSPSCATASSSSATSNAIKPPATPATFAMRLLPFFLAALALLGPVAVSAQTTSDATEIITIKSFEAHEGFSYTYGDWRHQTLTTPEGLIIAGDATAKGGGGGTVQADVRRAQSVFVTLRKLPAHRARVLNLILMDQGGRGAGFALNLANVTTDWTVLRLDIARQSFRPPNMEAGPDWSAITGYQVQGNHADSSSIAVQIREICAAPPPPASTL